MGGVAAEAEVAHVCVEGGDGGHGYGFVCAVYWCGLCALELYCCSDAVTWSARFDCQGDSISALCIPCIAVPQPHVFAMFARRALHDGSARCPPAARAEALTKSDAMDSSSM